MESVPRQDQSPARTQGRRHLEHGEVEAHRRGEQHARQVARLERQERPFEQRRRSAVRDHDALRPTRRARREHHVGQVFGADRDRRNAIPRVPRRGENVLQDHGRETCQGEIAQPSALGHHAADASLLGIRPQASGRVLRVQRDVRRAGPEDPEDRRDELGLPIDQHADPVPQTRPPREKGPSDPRGHPRERAVRDRPPPRDDCRRIGGLGGLRLGEPRRPGPEDSRLIAREAHVRAPRRRDGCGVENLWQFALRGRLRFIPGQALSGSTYGGRRTEAGGLRFRHPTSAPPHRCKVPADGAGMAEGCCECGHPTRVPHLAANSDDA